MIPLHTLYLFIFGQYVLLIGLALGVCFAKIILDCRNKKRSKEEESIKRLLKEIILGKKSFNLEEWQAQSLSIPLLTRVLEGFDANINSEPWREAKKQLAETLLLPWARHRAKSFFWSKRNLAARIFFLQPQLVDLGSFETLLKDRSFYIRMIVIEALAQIPSPPIIELLISQMASEELSARFSYRHALLKMPYEALLHVVEMYASSTDEAIRLACLDIMSHRFITNPFQVMQKDFQSDSLQIRIYVVKILGNLASEESVEVLMDFLNDSDPEVRSEAIISLGKIKSEKSFVRLTTMLHDSDYNVRLQAALALMQFGKQGSQLLSLQDWDLDPKAYEVARYVLTMP